MIQTPLSFLHDVLADPTDPASPLLMVGKGDLSTDEASYVTGDYGNRAYGLYLEIGDAETLEYADETTEQMTLFDIILEQRCLKSPTPAQHAAMLALYMEVSKMPGKVSHLLPNLPLYKRLKYAGGLGRPRTMTDPENWLTAGLRFAAHWRSNY